MLTYQVGIISKSAWMVVSYFIVISTNMIIFLLTTILSTNQVAASVHAKHLLRCNENTFTQAES